MRHFRKLSLIFAILLGLSITINVAAQDHRPAFFLPLSSDVLKSLELNLSAADSETLRIKGELTRFLDNPLKLELCLDSSIKSDLIANLQSVKPDLTIEALLVYPLPAKLRNDPERELKLFNILKRFKSMEGIEYYSESRKQMRVFYLKSTLIESEKSDKAIADSVSKILENQTLWARQEDSTFGNNIYRVDIRSLASGTKHLRMRNVNQIWYGIVPVLDPWKLDMHLLVQVRGDYLVFYGTTGLTVPKTFGIDEKAKTSFYNRMIAMYSWYTRELEKSSN